MFRDVNSLAIIALSEKRRKAKRNFRFRLGFLKVFLCRLGFLKSVAVASLSLSINFFVFFAFARANSDERKY